MFQQKSDSMYPSPPPHPYSNTKKVSQKVKYLLTTFMQDENREKINNFLKISYGITLWITFLKIYIQHIDRKQTRGLLYRIHSGWQPIRVGLRL